MADVRVVQWFALHTGTACVTVNNVTGCTVFHLFISASPAVSSKYYYFRKINNPDTTFLLTVGAKSALHWFSEYLALSCLVNECDTKGTVAVNLSQWT